ncbi:MAG: endonuclease/exonuclease/phosphatase family protein [Anaerolineae bacterium]
MHKTRRRLNRLGVAGLLLYIAALALLEAARRLARRADLRGLLGTQQGILLLAAPYLAPLAAILRPRGIGLVLAPALVAWVARYSALLLPRRGWAPAWAPRLTVLTFNLHAPDDGIAALAAVIRRANADVVALQEVSHTAAEQLPLLLAGLYPYQALHPNEEGPVGQGLLSRHPILEDSYWRNDGLKRFLGHQRCVIDYLGTPLTVYNVHAVPPFMFRQPFTLFPHAADVQRVLDRLEHEHGPLLLLGDLNMTDSSEMYHRLAARLTDAFRQAGSVTLGLTYPADARFAPPVVRLDHIFHDGAFRAIRVRTLPSSGSDHRPVWAELAMPTLAPKRPVATPGAGVLTEPRTKGASRAVAEPQREKEMA